MDTGKIARRILLPLLLLLCLIPGVWAAECPHEWVEHRIEPTCAGNGMIWYECALCGDTTGYSTLDPTGHEFSGWYVLTAPTCTQEGTQTRKCGICSFYDEAPIAKLGHDYVTEVVEPTCTARGKTVHQCSRCGDRFISDEMPPLGHRYDNGVILTEPTENTMGRILFTCIGCGDTYQLLYPKVSFVDLEKNTYYYIPVLWALSNGITAGVDETHFDPGGICTRAQVVTFLWSSAGKPEPESMSNPFLDVPKGSYCEKAILWAYESGITSGTDSTHFSPNAPCCRAHVVTFLHNYRGCPEPTITTAFPDVRPGNYYHKAVLWAAESGITAGMDGGYFRPASLCSRAQIVTFLYRDAQNS